MSIKKAVKHVVPGRVRDYLAWLISRRKLHQAMESNGIGDLVRASFRFRGAGIYGLIDAFQKEMELAGLAEAVRALNPRIIVEIGTARGGTLFVWTRSNPQLDLIVSIDLPGGRFGGGYDNRRTRLYQEFVHDRPQTRMILLRCDSHADSTLALLLQELGGRKIDFLFIDGDHTYDGVKRDFLTYSPLVRKGGIVAFHDVITKGGDYEAHKVHLLWDELKAQYPATEIIEDRSSNLMGIGILTV